MLWFVHSEPAHTGCSEELQLLTSEFTLQYQLQQLHQQICQELNSVLTSVRVHKAGNCLRKSSVDRSQRPMFSL